MSNEFKEFDCRAKAECTHKFDRRDCDGDWQAYCIKFGACKYQHVVRDCDGDYVTMCVK